jgi:hypothetical protein
MIGWISKEDKDIYLEAVGKKNVVVLAESNTEMQVVLTQEVVDAWKGSPPRILDTNARI